LFSNVSSLRKLLLRLLKLYVSSFICSSGDDPDDISSSGTEDDTDVHSFATELKGTLMLLRCVIITSVMEVMFLPLCVCVCLSISLSGG